MLLHAFQVVRHSIYPLTYYQLKMINLTFPKHNLDSLPHTIQKLKHKAMEHSTNANNHLQNKYFPLDPRSVKWTCYQSYENT